LSAAARISGPSSLPKNRYFLEYDFFAILITGAASYILTDRAMKSFLAREKERI